MINVLILSAGRRVELVQSFQRALAIHAPESSVIAGDNQSLAPALYYSDEAVLLPRVEEPHYIDELCKVIENYNVNLVVPTIDTELPILAEARRSIERHTGARLMIAEPWVIDICADKVRTHEHVLSNGLLAPVIYEHASAVQDENFPIILKPRGGSSSIGVNVVSSQDELEYLIPRTKGAMIQELVSGDEYTVDCFCDFEGNVISVVPRLRIATRAGEILKGRIVKDREIIEPVKHLLKCLPMPGHSTIQCFKTAKGIEFIEVNPRFGGGAPMSIAAGADSCSRIVRLLRGESLAYEENYEDGLTFLRFDQAIMIRDDETIVK